MTVPREPFGLFDLLGRVLDRMARTLADAPDTTAGSDLHALGLEPPRALDRHEWTARVVLPPH